MNKKYLSPLILLMIGLNVWRWWPESVDQDSVNNLSDSEEKFVDLRLSDTIYKIGLSGTAKRDIFNLEENSTTSTNWIKTQVEEYEEKKATELVKKKNSGATNVSSSRSRGTGKLVLAGVLIKDEKKHAFILSGGKEKSLTEGDVLNGVYRVSSINELSVELYNINTKSVFVLDL